MDNATRDTSHIPSKLTIKQVATYLKVQPQYVRRHVRDGKMEGFKVNAHNMAVTKKGFLEYLDSKGIPYPESVEELKPNEPPASKPIMSDEEIARRTEAAEKARQGTPHEMYYRLDGDKVKGILEKKGMTQIQLAEKIGTCTSRLSHYISGGERTNEYRIMAMADALEVDMKDIILGGNDEVILAILEPYRQQELVNSIQDKILIERRDN